MKRKEYERGMKLLHGELVAMQEWVKASGAKICIVFEGRDTAGEGGHDQADHRAGEPARVPCRGPARPDRA
jgi:polyphosphate kinase 2 (PPK2 family)